LPGFFVYRIRMCYSAQIRADYTKLVREYGAMMSLDEFAQLYAHDASLRGWVSPDRGLR
jgi:hypothetical protein